MARPDSPAIPRPARDEWGVYDPEQAGIAAVVARLDARAANAAPEVTDSTTERIESAPLERPRFGDAQ